jgi:hypothetical protein
MGGAASNAQPSRRLQSSLPALAIRFGPLFERQIA